VIPGASSFTGALFAVLIFVIFWIWFTRKIDKD
jgi:flagellar biogenesis protein FliO